VDAVAHGQRCSADICLRQDEQGSVV